MADEGGSSNIFGAMFKNFPVATIIICLFLVYGIWKAGGGGERGEARREAEQTGIFVEVTGVPDSFGNQELFSSVPAATAEETLEDLREN